MTYGRRLSTAAVFCLLSVLCVAAIAMADGEDDPSFNGAGSAFVAIGDGDLPLTDAVVDQAADGAVLSAVGIGAAGGGTETETLTLDSVPPRNGDGDEVIRVARLDSAGHLSGLDGDGVVDVDTPELGDVFDIEGMSDGRIVIASSGFGGAALGRASDEPADALVVTTLAADGEVLDQTEDEAPSMCEESDAWPAVAEIDPAGRVFAVWNDCSDTPVAARYSDDDVVTERLEDHESVGELAFGPDGDVFILGEAAMQSAGERLSKGTSFLARLDDDLDDVDYGARGEDSGTWVPGFPIDLAVDQAGRAVVWTDAPPRVATRGVGEAWNIYRFTPEGSPDGDWDEDGFASIAHPDLGQVSCNCPGHLIVQGDHKVIAVGLGSGARRGSDGPAWVVARLTAAGALDPTWDGDGVKGYDVEQPDTGYAYLTGVGEPGLQTDGKLLVPFLAQAGQIKRIPAPAYGGWLGVTRIGLTPAAPAPQQAAAPVPAAAVPASSVAASRVAPAKQCKSRRKFTIRLRTGRKKADRSPIVAATVRVNGKAVKVSRSARRQASVDLANLPKGRFTVSIRLRLKDGGIVRETRRYRTCAPKVERELGPLRTRPPR